MPETNEPPTDSTFNWLALERVPGVGPVTIARLVGAFGSPGAALQAGYREIVELTEVGERLARVVAEFDPPERAIHEDLKTLEKLEARVVTRWDDEYPSNLKDIYDPPALLFVRGEITPEDVRAVAVVGTRNPTRYGLEVAEDLSQHLVRAGVTLISGLARGIDTACHEAVLRVGGRTVGVLGCGLDVVYPRENKRLIEEMARSGAVMTEFRPGVRPLATNFYRRNRVVSGLSKGVVVIQAGAKSGSLITANHALDQNRDVFAVPGAITNAYSKGPHSLLKQGAAVVESADDILESLFPGPEMKVQPTLFQGTEDTPPLSDSAREVLEALDPDPIPMDVLCRTLGVDAGRLAGTLLELELTGMVKQQPGKMFSRTSR